MYKLNIEMFLSTTICIIWNIFWQQWVHFVSIQHITNNTFSKNIKYVIITIIESIKGQMDANKPFKMWTPCVFILYQRNTLMSLAIISKQIKDGKKHKWVVLKVFLFQQGRDAHLTWKENPIIWEQSFIHSSLNLITFVSLGKPNKIF